MLPERAKNAVPSSVEVNAALDYIKNYCFEHKLSIAVAESVSSGVLQSLFSSEEKAGLFFEGGITVYNCKQKHHHLGISQETCRPCNGVSAGIARQMALNVCELFKCRLGLSLTGYASPLPEEDIFDLFAFGSIALDGEIIYCDEIRADKQDPDELRADYAKILISECAKSLAKKNK